MRKTGSVGHLWGSAYMDGLLIACDAAAESGETRKPRADVRAKHKRHSPEPIRVPRNGWTKYSFCPCEGIKPTLNDLGCTDTPESTPGGDGVEKQAHENSGEGNFGKNNLAQLPTRATQPMHKAQENNPAHM